MDYFKIGNRVWNIRIIDVKESFNILYSDNSGRTVADGAEMALDPLGTFFGHKLVLQCKRGYEAEYDEFLEYIAKPRYNGIDVDLVHGQTTLAYKAYVSNGERPLKTIDIKSGLVKWGELTINIIPTKAQVLPL